MFKTARWFLSALLVSVGSLCGLTIWNSGLSSPFDLVLMPAIYAVYTSLYILPACLLAAGLRLLVHRFIRPREHYLRVLSIALGSVAGATVMTLGSPRLESFFLVIAIAAGGTGGAMSETETPFFSRRGAQMLLAGLVVSGALLVATRVGKH